MTQSLVASSKQIDFKEVSEIQRALQTGRLSESLHLKSIRKTLPSYDVLQMKLKKEHGAILSLGAPSNGRFKSIQNQKLQRQKDKYNLMEKGYANKELRQKDRQDDI